MFQSLVSSALSTVASLSLGPGGLPSSFKYTVSPSKTQTSWDSGIWALYSCTSKVDGSKATLFLCDKKSSRPELVAAARNAMVRLRTLRHPNVLRCLEAVETDSGVYIVTEEVVPLVDYEWDGGVLAQGQGPLCPMWGVYQVLSALTFLVSDCKLEHGAVGPMSVFVTKTGDFRLGSFELHKITSYDIG